MKHLTFLLFTFMSFSLFAQEGTTMEEYRYLSKGYLNQKELGLDIHKNGYSVKTIYTTSNNAELIGLYKDDEKDSKALLVKIANGGQAPVYICIPNNHSDEKVWSLYNLDAQRLENVETRKLYDSAMQEFLYNSLNNSYEMQKTTDPVVVLSNVNSTPVDSAELPVEEVMVSKGGTEMIILGEEPVPEKAAEQPAPKTITLAKATVSGDVRSRDVLFAPNVQIDSGKTGIVAVKICVDMDGYVTLAKFTERGSTTFDTELKKLSVDTASKYRFNKSDRREECGIIKFQF